MSTTQNTETTVAVVTLTPYVLFLTKEEILEKIGSHLKGIDTLCDSISFAFPREDREAQRAACKLYADVERAMEELAILTKKIVQ